MMKVKKTKELTEEVSKDAKKTESSKKKED